MFTDMDTWMFRKDMINLSKVTKFLHSNDGLQYGLVKLHAWIKFFECVIHVAYKIKKFQASEDTDKFIVKKKAIQQKMGLVVNYTKC